MRRILIAVVAVVALFCVSEAQAARQCYNGTCKVGVVVTAPVRGARAVVHKVKNRECKPLVRVAKKVRNRECRPLRAVGRFFCRRCH